jgi:GDPmannose 4,6-dehydratase
MAFKHVGISLAFEGEGENELGKIDEIDETVFSATTGQSFSSSSLKKGDLLVCVDPEYYRPTEVDLLIGDASKAKEKLGWTPTYNLKGLVEEMVSEDLKLFKKDVTLKSLGHNILYQAE